MPKVDVDCTSAHDALKASPLQNSLITTPHGLCIMELQGDLNLPDHVFEGATSHDEDGEPDFITINDVIDAAKFGRLEFDERDPTKAVLLVGKSQRLIGNIVNLDKPLGVLRVPMNRQEGASDPIKMMDVLKKKIIFNNRPLPIM